MLAIRLTRTGKRHEPHYRIIVGEVKSKRDGKNTDVIGHWHPKEGKLTLDRNAYQEWVERGAQPTEAVRELVASPPSSRQAGLRRGNGAKTS